MNFVDYIADGANIEALPWGDYDMIQLEAKAIRADMAAAEAILRDGIARYKKQKLKARSKRLAEDLEAMAAELDGYESTDEIIDAYGYDYITERERDRLLAIWEAREQAKRNGGIYTDRVIEILQTAMRCVGDKYRDKLDLADTMQKIANENRAEARREKFGEI